MNNASTADGRGQDVPNDAEPFFPSEGTFNAVVPLSEVGSGPVAAPAPLARFNAADAGKPAEADWARESHRAESKREDEETLVPARAARRRGATAPRPRPSWVFPALVITLSVMAGLASGAYLIWSSQPSMEAQRSAPPAAAAQPPAAQVAAEAPPLPPAPAAEAPEAEATVEKVKEAPKAEKADEVVKAEKPREPARAAPAGGSTPERPARAAAAEAREVKPAPKPARTQSAPTPRARVTTAERRAPAPAAPKRSLPVSSPPPSAKSSKVIQWP